MDFNWRRCAYLCANRLGRHPLARWFVGGPTTPAEGEGGEARAATDAAVADTDLPPPSAALAGFRWRSVDGPAHPIFPDEDEGANPSGHKSSHSDTRFCYELHNCS